MVGCVKGCWTWQPNRGKAARSSILRLVPPQGFWMPPHWQTSVFPTFLRHWSSLSQWKELTGIETMDNNFHMVEFPRYKVIFPPFSFSARDRGVSCQGARTWADRLKLEWRTLKQLWFGTSQTLHCLNMEDTKMIILCLLYPKHWDQPRTISPIASRVLDPHCRSRWAVFAHAVTQVF